MTRFYVPYAIVLIFLTIVSADALAQAPRRGRAPLSEEALRRTDSISRVRATASPSASALLEAEDDTTAPRKTSWRTIVRVFLGTRGEVLRTSIDVSSGDSKLDSTALRSVTGSAFRPVVRDGQAICAWILVPITFTVNDMAVRE